MYIDINAPDTLYINGIRAKWTAVDTVSNVEISKVIKCDTEAGWLERYQTDVDDNVIVSNNVLLVERINGSFELVPHW